MPGIESLSSQEQLIETERNLLTTGIESLSLAGVYGLSRSPLRPSFHFCHPSRYYEPGKQFSVEARIQETVFCRRLALHLYRLPGSDSESRFLWKPIFRKQYSVENWLFISIARHSRSQDSGNSIL